MKQPRMSPKKRSPSRKPGTSKGLNNTDQTPCLLVLTTVNSQEKALALAEIIVGEKAAACVSVIPTVHSIYRWQGAVESETEVLLLIKTKEDSYQAVESLIRRNHPYDVPEIIALPISRGEKNYLSWLSENS